MWGASPGKVVAVGYPHGWRVFFTPPEPGTPSAPPAGFSVLKLYEKTNQARSVFRGRSRNAEGLASFLAALSREQQSDGRRWPTETAPGSPTLHRLSLYYLLALFTEVAKVGTKLAPEFPHTSCITCFGRNSATMRCEDEANAPDVGRAEPRTKP